MYAMYIHIYTHVTHGKWHAKQGTSPRTVLRGKQTVGVAVSKSDAMRVVIHFYARKYCYYTILIFFHPFQNRYCILGI